MERAAGGVVTTKRESSRIVNSHLREVVMRRAGVCDPRTLFVSAVVSTLCACSSGTGSGKTGDQLGTGGAYGGMTASGGQFVAPMNGGTSNFPPNGTGNTPPINAGARPPVGGGGFPPVSNGGQSF